MKFYLLKNDHQKKGGQELGLFFGFWSQSEAALRLSLIINSEMSCHLVEGLRPNLSFRSLDVSV